MGSKKKSKIVIRKAKLVSVKCFPITREHMFCPHDLKGAADCRCYKDRR